MRRSPRVLLAWSIAIVVAAGTARIVTGDLAALHRRARNLGADVRVVLATHDLPLGTTIDAADVRVVVRPASTVAPDTLRETTRAIGRVVAVPVLGDDPIRARALVAPDRAGLDGLVPPGRRAVHVTIRDGFRPPVGSIVDVLAATDSSTGTFTADTATNDTATIVAAGARILAVDGAPDSDTNAAAGLTLLVTEAEARAVAYAAATAQLSVALAPIEGAVG